MIESKDGTTAPSRREEFSAEEEDAIAAEVQADIRAGQGMKHFADVWDTMLSENHQHQNTDAPDAHECDRIKRQEIELCRDLKLAATYMLVPQGMRVESVGPNGHGTGYRAQIKDGEGRRYDAEIHFDEAARLDLSIDPRRVFEAMAGTLVERALEARKRYFARACISIQSEPVVYIPEGAEKSAGFDLQEMRSNRDE